MEEVYTVEYSVHGYLCTLDYLADIRNFIHTYIASYSEPSTKVVSYDEDNQQLYNIMNNYV